MHDDPAPPSAEAVVREFWLRMASNDFSSLTEVLSEQFVLEWPQTRERIRGPAAFIQMNQEYPAHGPWRFDVRRVVANAAEVVTWVGITDGVQCAEAVTFFEVHAGKIVRVLEFWPEPGAPGSNREHLTEPLR